ncbi:MAG TPA: serine/threonine-protein kinase [Candidatus Nanoarchaeia archaeon]|nr:serine/threonine-protein kinase [Candidatus Nanoarchaeia archaeon]
MSEESGGKKKVSLAVPGYRLEKVLGQGAMGIVVKGRRETDNLEVAIKVMKPSNYADARARFQRESAVLLRINHPNVVRAYDVGELTEGEYQGMYMVLEYLRGKTLLGYIAESGALCEEEALEITRQTAEGLQCINENGLVHRDIKSDNIMITEDASVKIMDLGLAKAEEGGALTATGDVFGTPGYMSPEAAIDTKGADIRGDIYSLGCTLYQALTTHLPFIEKTFAKLLHRLLKEDPQPPKAHNPNLSDVVNALVLKMLARDREQRQQTPDELIEDIERVKEGKMPRTVRKPLPKKKGWWPFG